MVKTVTPQFWPEDYRIALFPYQGDTQGTADALGELDRFDPLLMRVETIGAGTPAPPGQYLLLRAEQAEHWDAALVLCGGRPDAATAYLTSGDPPPTLTLARRSAKVELLPSDTLAGEAAAYDVLVNGIYGGHWAETDDTAAVTWIPGTETVATAVCGADLDQIVAELRPSIPAALLPDNGHP